MKFVTIAVLGFALVAVAWAQAPADDERADLPDDIPDDADAVRERRREVLAFITGRRHIFVETGSRFRTEDVRRRARHRFLASLSGRPDDESAEADRLTFRFERQAEVKIRDAGSDLAADSREDAGDRPGDASRLMSERFVAAARDAFVNGVVRQAEQDGDDEDGDIRGRHRRSRLRVRVEDLACYDTDADATPSPDDVTKTWVLDNWSDWSCARFDEDGERFEGDPSDVPEDRPGDDDDDDDDSGIGADRLVVRQSDEEEAARVHHVTCTATHVSVDGCNVTVSLYFSREPRTVGEGEDAVTIDGREMKWDINAHGCSCDNTDERLGYGIQTRGRAHRARRAAAAEGSTDPDSDEIVAEESGDETDGEVPRFRFRRQATRPASCGTVSRVDIVRDDGVDVDDDADDDRDEDFKGLESNRRFIFLVQDDNTCDSADWDPSVGTNSDVAGQGNPLVRNLVIAAVAVGAVAVGALVFTKLRK